MPQLMSIEELATYLKLEKQTIYNWLHEKKISGIKVGHVWRFDRSAIDSWLKSQTVNAVPVGKGKSKSKRARSIKKS
ncbi:MAG: helix-turn-helix domain-containing protein [Candidatus Omnitrophica bacterium]|nr:helix-turn-helix domain-containing protein [Candidatus Omnitrophota bacterium]MBU4488441.1 helix-turn-helix domain-containing protein [Candidatus Omnitrophota bacterium]MCG2705154.1 helix-turn-helix domain-containing protein [Candidatus Omnitrophota bacterium]